MPNEALVDETDAIPETIVAEMKAMGLFGLSIPTDYGGIGLTMEEEVSVAFELGQTSPAFRSLFGTNNGIGSMGIVLDGTPEQKAKYLPRLASGELIGSFALTERGTPGLILGKPDRKMGQRGAHTSDVVFQDCRVPAAQLIGGREGAGFKT